MSIPYWQAFEDAGFEVNTFKDGAHVVLSSSEVEIEAYRTKEGQWNFRWFTQMHRGRTPEQVFAEWERGELEMPLEYDQSTCKFCGRDVWWAPKAKGDGKYPIDLNGRNHRLTCERDEMPAPWEADV